MKKNSKSQRHIPDDVKKQLPEPINGDIHHFDEIWDNSQPIDNNFAEPDEAEIDDALRSIWKRIDDGEGCDEPNVQKLSRRNKESGRRLPLLAAVILLSFGIHLIDNDDKFQASSIKQIETLQLDHITGTQRN